jgi:hypothetical protein
MATSFLEIQKQNKGIELLVGRNENQRKIKIVPILCNCNVDNEEAKEMKQLVSGHRCPCNCRFCLMKSKAFYKWKHSKAIMEQKREISKLPKTIIIDLITETQESNYPLRDTNIEMIWRKEAEIVWWKKILFNKDKMKKGHKILKLSEEEQFKLDRVQSINCKPWNNILFSHLFGFFNRRGSLPSLLPQNCLGFTFPADRLHTFWKGNLEYTFRFSSVILYLTGHTIPQQYGQNISTIDLRLIEFDIYQPIASSPWGNKVERRIPGLSSKYFIIFLKII